MCACASTLCACVCMSEDAYSHCLSAAAQLVLKSFSLDSTSLSSCQPSSVTPALGLQVPLTVFTFSCGFWESNSGLLSFKGSTLHHLLPKMQYSWFRVVKCKVLSILFNLYILRLYILSLKFNSRYSNFVGNKVIQMCKLIRN